MIFEKMTQMYSTFGDKLLQHTDVLYSIQNSKEFKPITIQLAPTEVCDLNCNYCSVSNREKTKSIPIEIVRQGLINFRALGAKSIEITGGGNPLLYPYINRTIYMANALYLDIGIITNSINPTKYLDSSSIDLIKWIRISMSAIDFNLDAKFELGNIPKEKLGLSYIINKKTTEKTIEKISEIASKYDVKFVRLAPDCLDDDSLTINEKWNDIINKYNSNGKIFLKEINDNFYPYPDICYIGLIRPYWTYSGVYICSSHVLKTRKYENEWKMCNIDNIFEFYNEANQRFKSGFPPYNIDINKCYHCYYFNNNKILHSVSSELPDRNFA